MKHSILLLTILCSLFLSGCTFDPGKPIKVEFYEPYKDEVFEDEYGLHGYVKSIQYRKEKSNVSIFDFTLFNL